MEVMAATMRVTHTFAVVLQEELAAVVCMGDVYPVHRRCVDGRHNPKPWPYLHLWGGVWIFLLHLVTPMDLRLGRGGVDCRL